MYNAGSAAQESGLSMTLTGLKLEKYQQLFNKKCIKFDTFVNMTKEDLISIGIFDQADQEAILDGVEPLKHLYKDINDLVPPDPEAILSSTVHHLRTILGLMIIIRRKILKKRPQNSLVDTTYSAGSVVIHLLETLDTELEYIKSDLLGNEVICKKEPYTSRKSWYVFGTLTAVVALISTVCIRHYGLHKILRNDNLSLLMQKCQVL